MELRRRMMSGGEKPFEEQYLTFEALEAGTFSIPTEMSYSLDGGSTWTTLAASTATPTIHSGEKILWRKVANVINTTFTATGAFKVYGNVMSLLYGDNFIEEVNLTNRNSAFNNLFKSNIYITDASDLILPATTLSTSCYANMFYGCTSLVTAPKILPATTLVAYCYSIMFYGCSKLEKSPILPATTLVKYCYQMMFRECSNMNHITCLATELGNTGNNLFVWVSGVKSSGTFVKSSSATNWPSGINGIPNNWTIVNV